MRYFLTFYRDGIYQAVIIAILFIWAATATIYSLRSEPKTLLIALTQEGPRVVTDVNDRAAELDYERFIYRFLGLSFNYTSKTYEESMSLAADLMSDSLFDTQKLELQKVNEALKSRELIQSGTISSIKRLEPGFYEVLVQTSQILDQTNQTFDTRVRLKIRKCERSTRNPWGIEVTEYKYERP